MNIIITGASRGTGGAISLMLAKGNNLFLIARKTSSHDVRGYIGEITLLLWFFLSYTF